MGSRTIGSLIVRLGMDPKDADKALKKFEKDLIATGKRMESVGKTLSIGFTAPFVLGMRQAIKAYDEEATAVRKLEVALGRSSTALLTQAAAIQKTTTFADDAVINIQAYAAALGHSEAQTQKMTQAAVNLAAGLGIGLDQAMEMLHKSTLGAAKGLGNLLPGVKDLTKEQLKSGAAIDMVNQRFAGYAETLAKTGAGPLKQFQNRWGDLMEQFGEAALPLLNKIIEKFTQLTEWFSKLSPETKELVVEVGALAALAGPVLLMAGNIIKLSDAFTRLGGSMKWLSGPYVAAFMALYGAGSAIDDALFKDENGNRVVRTDAGGRQYTETFGGSVALGREGRMYMDQLPQPISDQARASAANLFSDFILATGLKQPWQYQSLPAGAVNTNGGGGGGGYVGGAEKIGQTLVAASDWISKNFSTPRAAIPLQEHLDGLGYTGHQIEDGPDNVSMAGFGSGVASYRIPDSMNEGGMSTMLDGQKLKVEELNYAYQQLGSGISDTMTSLVSALADGGDAFAAFGKAALASGAMVVKSMLAVLLAKATAAAAAGGPFAAVAGLSIAIGVVSALEGVIGRIKTPKLAQGGVVQGPTMALMGDNPSGKEMALPWEKTREFASMISGYMGGGGQSVVGVIRGDDIHLVTARAQGYASRRGSGNLITF